MPKLDYANYSFNDLVSQLQTIIREKDTWRDVYASSTGQVLIELFAYVGQLLMYYIERRAQESYIGTAQLKSSVVNLVKLINYEPKRKVSSSGRLSFSIPTAHTESVYIPRNTNAKTADGTNYITLEDVVLLRGATTVSAPAIQGLIVEQAFRSNGSMNQVWNIADTEVENTHIEVSVDTERWTRVTSFVESLSNSLHYRVTLNLDSTISIIFGDGKFGKIPPYASSILVRYVRSKGSAGNVYSVEVINTLSSILRDALGNVVNVSVSNPTHFLGGDDEEGIEEIRYEAPRVFKTGDRAVTREDFKAILDNYPGIAIANAWGEAEETPPDITLMNVVRIAIILEKWARPDVTFKEALASHLKTKAQLTVRYEFVDPTFIDVLVVDEVRAFRAFALSTVTNDVGLVLDKRFALGTVRIGAPIRYSDVNRAIDEVSGVDFHHLELWLRQSIGVGNEMQTTFASTLHLPPVRPHYVKIYSGVTLVAQDNGVGGLVEVGGSGVIGSIVYNTGLVSVTFVAAPLIGVEISVEYRQISTALEPNDLVVGRNQILKLYDKRITTRYA